MLSDTEWRYTLSAFFYGVIIGLLVPLVILSLLLGCATKNVPQCTFVCRSSNVPDDCYCLEEEINREADSILKNKRPDSNGFHP